MFCFSLVCCSPCSLARSLARSSIAVSLCAPPVALFFPEKRKEGFACVCLFVCFVRGDGRVWGSVVGDGCGHATGECGAVGRANVRGQGRRWKSNGRCHQRLASRTGFMYYLIILSFTWQYLGSFGQALLDERERRLLCCCLTFWCQVLKKESGIENRSCSLHHYYIHSLHLREWYCKILRNVNESRRKAFWRIDVDVRDVGVRVSCSRRIVKKIDLWLLVFSLSLCVSLRLQSALP